VNKKFTSYCITQCIQMQHIVPYTPHKYIIQSKGLSLHYWVEAINCANYIVNQTPTKALKNITLEKAWTKIKTYASHFCVFGSVAWAHIPNEKMKVS
jgi:hypothetical protein